MGTLNFHNLAARAQQLLDTIDPDDLDEDTLDGLIEAAAGVLPPGATPGPATPHPGYPLPGAEYHPNHSHTRASSSPKKQSNSTTLVPDRSHTPNLAPPLPHH